MGYCIIKDILSLEKVVNGMKISNKISFDCPTCIKGKMVEPRNHKADVKVLKPLDLVHTDSSGCVTPASYESSKYYITFVDDNSNMTIVYYLKNKSDTAAATARFIADMAPFGKIIRLRSDNGLEFTGDIFRDLMIKNKIGQEFSAPYAQF